MITSHQRGHPIIFEDNKWVYADDKTSIGAERSCVVCKLMPAPDGHDPCFGHIKGVVSACCGHGVEPGYVIKANGERDDLGTVGTGTL